MGNLVPRLGDAYRREVPEYAALAPELMSAEVLPVSTAIVHSFFVAIATGEEPTALPFSGRSRRRGRRPSGHRGVPRTTGTMTESRASGSAADARPGTALLEASQLVTGFGATQVLHGVDLVVEAGEAHGIFGLNGVGKSVTLKAISGLLPLRSGSVRLKGKR